MESKLSLTLFLPLFCLFLCLRNPLLVHSQNWIYWQRLAKLMQKRPSLKITPNSAGKPLLDTPMTFLWWWSWEGVWHVGLLRVFKHRKIIDKFGPCLSWKHSKHPNFLFFFFFFKWKQPFLYALKQITGQETYAGSLQHHSTAYNAVSHVQDFIHNNILKL